MLHTIKPRNSRAPAIRNDALVRATVLRCSLGLERQLSAISTANKTRVLLALHANIAEQLESLENDNSQ